MRSVGPSTSSMTRAAQPGRRSCAGLRVTVRQYLDGHLTVSQGTRPLGRFTADGQPVVTAPVPLRAAV